MCTSVYLSVDLCAHMCVSVRVSAWGGVHSGCVELRRRKESRPELSLGMEAFLCSSPELGTCAWNGFQAPVRAGGLGPPSARLP